MHGLMISPLTPAKRTFEGRKFSPVMTLATHAVQLTTKVLVIIFFSVMSGNLLRPIPIPTLFSFFIYYFSFLQKTGVINYSFAPNHLA